MPQTVSCTYKLLDTKNGVWRNLVAHLLWEQGVVGSNPVTPISDICCFTALGIL